MNQTDRGPAAVTPACVLREASREDVAVLLGLLKESFEEYRGRLLPPSGALTETAERLRDQLISARAIIAEVASVPAGCVFYTREEDHVYLFRLAVRPAYRRQGIGRRLIESVERRAWQLGRPRVRLGVRHALTGNRAYYERLGYRFAEDGPRGAQATYYALLEKTIVVPKETGAP